MIAAALVLALAGVLELRRAGALVSAACSGLGLPARQSFQDWRRSGVAGVVMVTLAGLLLALDRLGVP